MGRPPSQRSINGGKRQPKLTYSDGLCAPRRRALAACSSRTGYAAGVPLVSIRIVDDASSSGAAWDNVHDALEAAGEDWSDYIHLGQRPHDMMPLRLARGRPNTIGRSMKSGYWI
jgi:hypothetical protein